MDKIFNFSYVKIDLYLLMKLYLPCHKINIYVQATKKKQEIFENCPVMRTLAYFESSMIRNNQQ